MGVSVIRLSYRFGNWRWGTTLFHIQDQVGVNNVTKDGYWIPVWDFDGVTLSGVTVALRAQQSLWLLPELRILKSGAGNNYLAYCFKKCEWPTCVNIVAGTPGVDMQFVKYGVGRMKFTLRTDAKHGMEPKLIRVLSSTVKPDCTPADLWSWVRYETTRD